MFVNWQDFILLIVNCRTMTREKRMIKSGMGIYAAKLLGICFTIPFSKDLFEFDSLELVHFESYDV